jgi:hypothetical protein
MNRAAKPAIARTVVTVSVPYERMRAEVAAGSS